MLTVRQKAWLVYRRLRTATGITLGYVMIFAALTSSFVPALLPIAVGFWLIHLSSDVYNDSRDYETDLKNKRKDKWTVSGLISVNGMRTLSKLLGAAGVSVLLLTNLEIFIVGFAFAVTCLFYSHPAIRWKNRTLAGYAAITIPIFFFPLAWSSYLSIAFGSGELFLSLFFGFHYLYFTCQKDATDANDDTNLFKKFGWKNASLITSLFGILAIIFFIPVSSASVAFIPAFFFFSGAVVINLYLINRKIITRNVRSQLVLIKFLVPYIFSGVGLFG